MRRDRRVDDLLLEQQATTQVWRKHGGGRRLQARVGIAPAGVGGPGGWLEGGETGAAVGADERRKVGHSIYMGRGAERVGVLMVRTVAIQLQL